MKWLYLPALFTLAFVYTKYTLNDFLPKHGTPRRAPSSVAIEEKYQLKNKTDYRVIPPLFFRELAKSPIQETFKTLAIFKGSIVEDTQMENFHFSRNKKGNIVFTIKNINNFTEGNYHNDFLIHLISIRQIDQQLNWKDYFEAYQKGLLSKSHELSFYMEREYQSASYNNEQYFLSKIKTEAPFRFKISHKQIEKSELLPILSALKEKFPLLEIYDHYKNQKSIGRKENLLSYQILARLRPYEQLRWLDMTERRDKKLDDLNDEYDLFNFNLTIEKKSFLVSDKEMMGVTFNLNQYHHDEYKDIALDQAYLLGKIHRQSLGADLDKYLSALSLIRNGQIEETVIMLKFKLRDMLNGKEI